MQVLNSIVPNSPVQGKVLKQNSYRSGSKLKGKRQSANCVDDRQLHLWEPPQTKTEAPYLQIQSVPVNERVSRKEPRYVLVILPHGIRACGGQFTAEEAHAITQKTKGWDWSLDANNRPRCLPALEHLLDRICHASSQCGGEG